ncbi:MAG: response regulator transcription factor [Thermoflexales bacterium]|nr:response regulator transcription factor [Thermoflexales bacterium]
MLGMIVEDDPDLSFIFGEALQAAGFEVEIFHQGGSALARLAQPPEPDMIILDYHLPQASGEEILAYVRARLANTKIIMASSDPRIVGLDADMVLIKPVLFTEMRAAIQCLMGKECNP